MVYLFSSTSTLKGMLVQIPVALCIGYKYLKLNLYIVLTHHLNQDLGDVIEITFGQKIHTLKCLTHHLNQDLGDVVMW